MLPIDQICKIILANPLLEKLYVDQTFLANEVDEMRSYLQEFLSEKCSPNNLRIICRGYGPNIQKCKGLKI
jgi:pentatricopeptide repeat protein